jgi:hypothetical protein
MRHEVVESRSRAFAANRPFEAVGKELSII